MAVAYDETVAYNAGLTYTDAAGSPILVPGTYQVGINGVGFRLDDREGRGIQRRSVPFLRNQADTSSRPGAQSLSPAGVWRSYQEDWSRGAGQSNRDRTDSDAARFRSSKGLYVWDRWKMSLLADTAQKRASSELNLRFATARGYFYVTDGNDLYWTTSLSGTPTWANANIGAGEAADYCQSICSDGRYIYVGFSTNGVHRTDSGATTSTHYNDLAPIGSLAYIKNRLMASKANAIYNITAAGAAPAALYTHPVADWTWRGWASGPTHIYAGGYIGGGDRSAIYKITLQPDGTALAAPTVAVDLPYGELVLDLVGYLGYICIATTKGVRLASIASDGNLTLGSLIPIPGNASFQFAGFEPQDRFVWFSWPGYDASSSGLGRLDLSTFTAPLTPAYASDLMGPLGFGVTSVTTFADKRVFAVSNQGIYAEVSNKVSTGTMDCGDISFGITDAKVATSLTVAHDSLLGRHEAFLAVDGGAFSSLGIHAEGGAEGAFTIPETKGERFEIRHTLTRNTATTGGPTLTRSTLSTYPTPGRPSEVFVVWVQLFEQDMALNGATISRDPRAELDAIIALEKAGTVIDFQLGDQSYRALIEDHNFASENELPGKWWNGSVELTVRAI